MVRLGGTPDARVECMRMIATAPALLMLVLLSGACATGLAPAPGTLNTSGAGEGAVTEIAGVRVEARVEAWRRFPRNLNEAVTPFLVRIDNHSGVPLQVVPAAFALVDEAGNRLAAAPAGAIDAIVREERLLSPMASPGYPYTVSPYGAMVGPRPWAFEPYPFGTAWRRWGDTVIELPTAAMLEAALPEGVVSPGAYVRGFVYFPRPLRAIGDVVFEARLVRGDTAELIGVATIPFVEE